MMNSKAAIHICHPTKLYRLLHTMLEALYKIDYKLSNHKKSLYNQKQDLLDPNLGNQATLVFL